MPEMVAEVIGHTRVEGRDEVEGYMWSSASTLSELMTVCVCVSAHAQIS